MIHAVHIENFKSHIDTTFAPDRLTILVGPNASGKTSILEALALLGELGRTPIAKVFCPGAHAETFVRRGAAEPMGVTAVVQSEAATATWKAFVKRKPGLELSEAIVLEPRSKDRATLSQDVAKYLATRLLRLDVDKVGEPYGAASAETQLSLDGSNTAALLATLKLADDPRFDAIRDGLRAIVPSVVNLRVKHAKLASSGSHGEDGAALGYRVHFDFNGADDVPASMASEGTRVALALMTALHGDGAPKVLLLDDIDQGLHPRAQLEVVKQLQGVLARDPELQILATTHSPYVLDAVPFEDVWVCYPGADGGTKIRRLSEHPDAERTKGALTAGQLWLLEPESWVEDSP